FYSVAVLFRAVLFHIQFYSIAVLLRASSIP
uniref:Uncharacterized protein n=1 Tax=Caenorhabditis japonica TaxID=281687 RepID=A0A8R1DPT6_CAEJA